MMSVVVFRYERTTEKCNVLLFSTANHFTLILYDNPPNSVKRETSLPRTLLKGVKTIKSVN